MNQFSRRSFLKRSTLAAGAFAVSASSWARVPGANDDIRMAVVGFNGRGRNHIDAWTKLEGVRLTALCDVDSKVLDAEVKRMAEKHVAVQGFTDIRKLLASNDVDAISIATPNHWHALATIWGVQAGKDVYVEKPVSYDVWEGERMVEAAHKYRKIVQAGTQSRSSEGIKQMVAWIQKGNLGKIRVARALCYKPRPSIGKTDGPQPVPATVDYDLWCGPAPKTPPHRRRFHYDWHWFWDYGAGDIGNQGIHQMDIARWFLGERTVSPRVLSIGGRLGYVDDGQTPNTMIAFHDYHKAPLVMEVRGLPTQSGSKEMDKYKGAQIGVIIECEGGYVRVPGYTGAIAFDKDGKEIKRFEGATSHFANFIHAVRNRAEDELNAPIREGHISTALCHTANISYRAGLHARPEAIHEEIKADAEAESTFNRMAEHLAANGVDISLDSSLLTLGAALKMNPGNEMFIHHKKANYLLARSPRKPFTFRLS